MDLSVLNTNFSDQFPQGQWKDEKNYFYPGRVENFHRDIENLSQQFWFICPGPVLCKKLEDGTIQIEYIFKSAHTEVLFHYTLQMPSHSWFEGGGGSFKNWSLYEYPLSLKFPINFKGQRSLGPSEISLGDLPKGAGIYAHKNLHWVDFTSQFHLSGKSFVQVYALCSQSSVFQLKIGPNPVCPRKEDWSLFFYKSLIEQIEKMIGVEVDQIERYFRILLVELEQIHHHLDFLVTLNLEGFNAIQEELKKIQIEIQEILNALIPGQNKKKIFRMENKNLEDLGRVFGILISLMGKIDSQGPFLEKKIRAFMESSSMEMRGVGPSREIVMSSGLGGINLRAFGFKVDHRMKDPDYLRLGYRLNLGIEGSFKDRLLLRLGEVVQSSRLIGRLIDRMMELISQQEFIPRKAFNLLESLNGREGVLEIHDVEGNYWLNYKIESSKLYALGLIDPGFTLANFLQENSQNVEKELYPKWFASFNLHNIGWRNIPFPSLETIFL